MDTGTCKGFNEAVFLFNDANKLFKKVNFFYCTYHHIQPPDDKPCLFSH